MNNLINTYRQRILKSALLRHQRKTGSTCIIINMPKGGINTIELTEILIDGLLRRFEKMILSEYGNIEGVKAIRGIYSSAVDVNGRGEFLTESGKVLIDELISELVEFAKKKSVTAETNHECSDTNYHARTSKYRADDRERKGYPRAPSSERRGYSIAGDFFVDG